MLKQDKHVLPDVCLNNSVVGLDVSLVIVLIVFFYVQPIEVFVLQKILLVREEIRFSGTRDDKIKHALPPLISTRKKTMGGKGAFFISEI